MISNDVVMRINGKDFAGWTSVSISAGIDRLARNFNLDITRQWPNASDLHKLRFPVVDGDLVEILIGSDKVVTGYADSTPLRYDATSVSASISGRSKTEDLIDCSAATQPGQFTNRTLAQIATALIGPFGLNVNTLTNKSAVLTSFQIDYGETISEALNRLLGLEQVLAFDDASGNVLLDIIGNEKATTALVLGQNIISGDSSREMNDRFSEYTVSGQRAGTDDDYGATTNSKITATVKDSGVKRYRPLIIKQCGNATVATCRTRAQFEMLRRQAKTLETTYVVQGWRQGDGKLWQPNMRVIVSDPVMGFDNAELVIAEVTWSLGDGGYTCSLRVGPIAAYLPEPPDPEKRHRHRHDDSEVF